MIFTDGTGWELRGFTNCNTSGVVYLITCPCGLQYVGMTTRKVKLRISEHRSIIRYHKQSTKLTAHLLEMNHTADDVKWVVLEALMPWNDLEKRLFEREQRWVFRLSTHPTGLNENLRWGQFITH